MLSLKSKISCSYKKACTSLYRTYIKRLINTNAYKNLNEMYCILPFFPVTQIVPQEEHKRQTVDEHPTGNDEGNNLMFKARK